jgi:hypothetical protein
MKTTLSILFSFALLWSQSVFAAGNTPSQKSAGRCGKCECAMLCCAKLPPLASQPAPPPPTRSFSPDDLQLGAILRPALQELQPQLSIFSVAPCRSTPPSSVSVQERLCVFLI